MPTLTRTEVEAIALLARLHLEPDEIERMQTELGAILEYFGTIDAVDTTHIRPMTHAVATDMQLRADTAAPSLTAADALRGAPREGDLIVVPAIISARSGSDM